MCCLVFSSVLSAPEALHVLTLHRFVCFQLLMRSKACNSLLVAYHCIVLDVVSVCGACAKSFLCFMVMLRMEKPSLVESFALYMQLKNSFITQVFLVWTCFYKLATKMHCSSDLHEVKHNVRFTVFTLTELLCYCFQGSRTGMSAEEERICQMSREPSCRA